MASPTQWTWVWASSRRWWRTGKVVMRQPTGLQIVRHEWVIEQHFADKSPYSQSYSFSRVHVQIMWELDHKEGWMPKKWWFWIVLLQKTLESHLDIKEIKQVNPKWNQCWIFIGSANAEAEALILWPSDAKSQLTGIILDAGKDWWQEEKDTTEDVISKWCH